jgi:XRE family transcriptional regulator, regulator of sulfur utilization
MDLGTTIKTMRQKRSIKQKDFAVQCDITAAYLSQIENNQKDPNLSTLRSISAQLGLPLPILLFLSLDEQDVKPEKQAAFNLINSPVKSLISEFFLN